MFVFVFIVEKKKRKQNCTPVEEKKVGYLPAHYTNIAELNKICVSRETAAKQMKYLQGHLKNFYFYTRDVKSTVKVLKHSLSDFHGLSFRTKQIECPTFAMSMHCWSDESRHLAMNHYFAVDNLEPV